LRSTFESPAAIDRQARALRERLIALTRRGSLRDPVAAACEQARLTPPQIHGLLWLGHEGPLTMGDLARHLSVTEKTVTGIVDRLERDRIVQRSRDGADRRVVRVRLTARGGTLYRRIDAGFQAKVASLLALLDPADRRALFRILDTLRARLAAAVPASGRQPTSDLAPRARRASRAHSPEEA
jgi:DNA-binding MarR family transcriptional regulator